MCLCLCSCVQLKYENDISLVPPLLANSGESLVFLNKSVCKDADNKIGFCAKRIKTDEDLVIYVEAQQYPYELALDCADSLGVDQSFTVKEKESFEFTIPSKNYGGLRFFNCTVDIYPLNRPEPIGSFAAFRVMLVDVNYMAMPNINYQGGFTVFGKNAYLTKADNEEYKEKTFVKGSPRLVQVESYIGRKAYAGY